MRINRAVGLGIGILVLQWLMGGVFAAFEQTLLSVFDFTQAAISVADVGVMHPATQVGTSLLP